MGKIDTAWYNSIENPGRDLRSKFSVILRSIRGSYVWMKLVRELGYK